MGESEEQDIACDGCDFRFVVIFSNDAECQHRAKMGLPIIGFCPRCGEELEDSDEEW